MKKLLLEMKPNADSMGHQQRGTWAASGGPPGCEPPQPGPQDGAKHRAMLPMKAIVSDQGQGRAHELEPSSTGQMPSRSGQSVEIRVRPGCRAITGEMLQEVPAGSPSLGEVSNTFRTNLGPDKKTMDIRKYFGNKHIETWEKLLKCFCGNFSFKCMTQKIRRLKINDRSFRLINLNKQHPVN